MSFLREPKIHSKREFVLTDVAGSFVGRAGVSPQGSTWFDPDPYRLAGSWRREGQVLELLDRRGALRARFAGEGLDRSGRHVLWGRVELGGHWLEHALRELFEPRKLPQISFCTVCKGRLHHLRETLPRNLEDNRDYPHLEFVLLDYHSEDGLEEWAGRELGEHIDSGRLSYYRLPTPGPFRAAHARNLAIRLAAGKVVCVVDADNYTGRGFAHYVADTLRPDVVLVGCGFDDGVPQVLGDEGCVGRFAIHRDAFLDVGGMDEEHAGWGYDDLDLYARLRARGYEPVPIPAHYLQCIAHDDEERRRYLEEREIGRDAKAGGGTLLRNHLRSERNLSEGRIVVNNGRVGCGGVIKNLGRSALVVHERRNPKLSICVVCGDQPAVLRENLPRNLESVKTYPEVEFVIHEAARGESELGGWLKGEFAPEVSAGRIVHCQMAPPYLEEVGAGNRVHHHNQAMRVARGDILCSCPPDSLLPRRLTSRLLAAYHEGWIHQASPEDPRMVWLSRHLFYLAEGLDQRLGVAPAHRDLVARIEAQLAGEIPPRWSGDGLESRDFGGGAVWRAGELEVISPHRFPRISLTTPCMGRLEHLRRTLAKNLADNADYPNLEFVLLNYGDRSGLDDWVRGELREHVESGRLVYYHSPDESVWRYAHAKNLALRLAGGEVLCNLDADNFTGHHFAFHLAERLREHDFLVGCHFHRGTFDSSCDQGTGGRVALPRWAFYQAGGHDEAMTGWGFDDRDLCQRLLAQGLRPATVDGRFLRCIEHGDEYRTANQNIPDNSGTMTADRGTARRNRERSARNVAAGRLVANAGGFGCGAVTRGFEAKRVVVGPVRYRKVSICVVCMGRRHHLAETLPRNLADNAHYPDLEFVLLDYNSGDGLEEWVAASLREQLESGRVTYYRTTEQSFFDRSHARNVAFRLARGEILCNVDADNFTGQGFASYVNERFGSHRGVFLQPDFEGAHRGLRDAFGRLCVRRADFLNVEGYDEGLKDYGWEDNDLCMRLRKSGLRPLFFEDDRFLRYIAHDNEERMAHGMLADRLALMLVGRRPGRDVETVLCLLNDGGFFSIGSRLDGMADSGSWTKHNGQLSLSGRCGTARRLLREGSSYALDDPDSELRLKRSGDARMFLDAYFHFSMETNARRYRANESAAGFRVNGGRFGRALVARNFSAEKLPVEAYERSESILR